VYARMEWNGYVPNVVCLRCSVRFVIFLPSVPSERLFAFSSLRVAPEYEPYTSGPNVIHPTIEQPLARYEQIGQLRRCHILDLPLSF